LLPSWPLSDRELSITRRPKPLECFADLRFDEAFDLSRWIRHLPALAQLSRSISRLGESTRASIDTPKTIKTTPINPVHRTPLPGPVNANELDEVGVAGGVED
jgi:hypothetical protein